MRAVGIKVLKNKLSEYVRLAAGGERVLITDRDRVVAELRAPESGAALVADALLAEVVRSGLMSAPLAPPVGVPPRLPVATLATLLAELDQDRDR